MSSGILAQLALVVRGGNQLAAMRHHRSDRHVLVLGGTLSLAQRQAHEVLVAWKEVLAHGWEALARRTGSRLASQGRDDRPHEERNLWALQHFIITEEHTCRRPPKPDINVCPAGYRSWPPAPRSYWRWHSCSDFPSGHPQERQSQPSPRPHSTARRLRTAHLALARLALIPTSQGE